MAIRDIQASIKSPEAFDTSTIVQQSYAELGPSNAWDIPEHIKQRENTIRLLQAGTANTLKQELFAQAVGAAGAFIGGPKGYLSGVLIARNLSSFWQGNRLAKEQQSMSTSEIIANYYRGMQAAEENPFALKYIESQSLLGFLPNKMQHLSGELYARHTSPDFYDKDNVLNYEIMGAQGRAFTETRAGVQMLASLAYNLPLVFSTAAVTKSISATALTPIGQKLGLSANAAEYFSHMTAVNAASGAASALDEFTRATAMNVRHSEAFMMSATRFALDIPLGVATSALSGPILNKGVGLMLKNAGADTALSLGKKAGVTAFRSAMYGLDSGVQLASNAFLFRAINSSFSEEDLERIMIPTPAQGFVGGAIVGGTLGGVGGIKPLFDSGTTASDMARQFGDLTQADITANKLTTADTERTTDLARSLGSDITMRKADADQALTRPIIEIDASEIPKRPTPLDTTEARVQPQPAKQITDWEEAEFTMVEQGDQTAARRLAQHILDSEESAVPPAEKAAKKLKKAIKIDKKTNELYTRTELLARAKEQLGGKLKNQNITPEQIKKFTKESFAKALFGRTSKIDDLSKPTTDLFNLLDSIDGRVVDAYRTLSASSDAESLKKANAIEVLFSLSGTDKMLESETPFIKAFREFYDLADTNTNARQGIEDLLETIESKLQIQSRLSKRLLDDYFATEERFFAQEAVPQSNLSSDATRAFPGQDGEVRYVDIREFNNKMTYSEFIEELAKPVEVNPVIGSFTLINASFNNVFKELSETNYKFLKALSMMLDGEPGLRNVQASLDLPQHEINAIKKTNFHPGLKVKSRRHVNVGRERAEKEAIIDFTQNTYRTTVNALDEQRAFKELPSRLKNSVEEFIPDRYKEQIEKFKRVQLESNKAGNGKGSPAFQARMQEIRERIATLEKAEVDAIKRGDNTTAEIHRSNLKYAREVLRDMQEGGTGTPESVNGKPGELSSTFNTAISMFD